MLCKICSETCGLHTYLVIITWLPFGLTCAETCTPHMYICVVFRCCSNMHRHARPVYYAHDMERQIRIDNIMHTHTDMYICIYMPLEHLFCTHTHTHTCPRSKMRKDGGYVRGHTFRRLSEGWRCFETLWGHDLGMLGLCWEVCR